MLTAVLQCANNDYGADPLRRTAIALNSLSLRLSKGDQIVLVDNGTPDHKPALIQEVAHRKLLTPLTLGLLRSYRMTMETYREIESSFGRQCVKVILDEIVRNAAFRQRHPDTKWLLTTGTDVVPGRFRHKLDSLSPSRPYVAQLRRVPHRIWSKWPAVMKAADLPLGMRHVLRSSQRTKPWHGWGKAGDFMITSVQLFEAVRGFEELLSFGWGHSDANFLRKCFNLTGKGPRRFADVGAFCMDHGGVPPGRPGSTGWMANSVREWVDNFTGSSTNAHDWGSYPLEEIRL